METLPAVVAVTVTSQRELPVVMSDSVQLVVENVTAPLSLLVWEKVIVPVGAYPRTTAVHFEVLPPTPIDAGAQTKVTEEVLWVTVRLADARAGALLRSPEYVAVRDSEDVACAPWKVLLHVCAFALTLHEVFVKVPAAELDHEMVPVGVVAPVRVAVQTTAVVPTTAVAWLHVAEIDGLVRIGVPL